MKHNAPFSLSWVLLISTVIVVPTWVMLLANERKKTNVKIADGIVDISIKKLMGSSQHRFEISNFESIESHHICLRDKSDIRLPSLYWIVTEKERYHLDSELITYTPLGKFVLDRLENQDENIELNVFVDQGESVEHVVEKNHRSIFDA